MQTPYESHNVSGYRVDFFHGEDDGIVVEVPAILGCFTQGKDREEALANAAEAIAVSIEPDSPIAQLIAERDEARSGVAHLTAGIASIGEAIGLVLAAQQKRAEERQTLEALVKEQEATIARLTAEQGTLIASALAGIEAVTKSNQALRTAAASIAGRDTFEGILMRLGSAAAEARGLRFNGSICGEDGVEQDIGACIEAMKRERKGKREVTEIERLRASMRRAKSLLDAGLRGPQHQRGDLWAAHKELGDALGTAD